MVAFNKYMNILSAKVILLYFLFAHNLIFGKSILILDNTTKNPIYHCEIIIDHRSTGIFSAEDGRVNIEVGDENKNIEFFALGYDILKLNSDVLDTINIIFLEPLAYNLRDVIITDSLQMPIQMREGAILLNAMSLSKLPMVFAEPDLLKSLQLLSGVSSVMENNVGLYLRGGRAEQTLISIDGATVYNPAHSVGLFSVVHPSSVNFALLYKGGIPAHFGGRASGFLDIKLKEGSYKDFRGAFSLGVVSSYLDLQGPILQGKHPVSFQFVGRTTYIDKIVKVMSSKEPEFNTGFSDFSMKISSIISTEKRLSLAYYHSNDHYKYENSNFIYFGNESKWNNDVIGLNFRCRNSDKWLKLLSATFTNYRLSNILSNTQLQSGIYDFGLNYSVKSSSIARAVQEIGVQSVLHKISPGKLQVVGANVISDIVYDIPEQQFLEVAPFFIMRKEIGMDLELMANFRMGTYLASSIQSVQPEPRITLTKNYDKSKVYICYDRLSQFMQLYSSNVTLMPTDFWFMSSKSIKPTTSNSLSLTYHKGGLSDKCNIETSVYYRVFNHITDIRPGGSSIATPEFEKWLEVGVNHSYGIEFMIQKIKGKLTGWLSYTYSRSINSIPGILSNGSKYSANYDKPHLFNVVAKKHFGKWEFNGVFVFQSGRPITKPLYSIGIINLYSDRNEYRLPSYHRLDISLIHYQKRHKHFQASWMLSIYNVYNHHNVYNIQYNPLKGRVEKITVFPILPFISYKVDVF
ncbi:TonB-dependent receptor plug domain-containing protein [bacterium]|nr:TonB-dependent receptor plug domain-containing protein [bacterium]